jgi:hypothetical protein
MLSLYFWISFLIYNLARISVDRGEDGHFVCAGPCSYALEDPGDFLRHECKNVYVVVSPPRQPSRSGREKGKKLVRICIIVPRQL